MKRSRLLLQLAARELRRRRPCAREVPPCWLDCSSSRREVPKTRGQSGSELLVFACFVAGLQSWIPLLELPPEGTVEDSRPGLQHELRTGPRPPHLLTLAKTFAHHRVDGALHKPGGDTFAVTPPFGIVGNHPRVVADVDLELAGSLSERLHARVVGLEAFQPVEEFVDHTQAAAEVTVPQVTLDAAQETVRGVRVIRIVMAQSLDVLAHDGDSHGDVEPVEQVLGGRGHVQRHVLDCVTAVGQKGDRLVFLPSLFLQDIVQAPLGLRVMGVNKAEVAVRAIGGHGLGDHDLEMRLLLVPRADIAAIDSDRDASFRQRHGGPIPRACLDEEDLFICQFAFHTPGGLVKMVAHGLGIQALADGQDILEKMGRDPE